MPEPVRAQVDPGRTSQAAAIRAAGQNDSAWRPAGLRRASGGETGEVGHASSAERAPHAVTVR